MIFCVNIIGLAFCLVLYQIGRDEHELTVRRLDKICCCCFLFEKSFEMSHDY